MQPAASNALASPRQLESDMARMHPLHDYIAGQISERLKARRVVVMYDKREELGPFFKELASGSGEGNLVPIRVGQQAAKLHVFDGSFLKTRTVVEGVTHGDQPEHVLVY